MLKRLDVFERSRKNLGDRVVEAAIKHRPGRLTVAMFEQVFAGIRAKLDG